MVFPLWFALLIPFRQFAFWSFQSDLSYLFICSKWEIHWAQMYSAGGVKIQQKSIEKCATTFLSQVSWLSASLSQLVWSVPTSGHLLMSLHPDFHLQTKIVYTTKKTGAWIRDGWKTLWKPPWLVNSDPSLSWNLWFTLNPQISLVQYPQIDPKCWDQIGPIQALA